MSQDGGQATQNSFKLPAAVVGRADVAQLLRELEGIENSAESAQIRHQQAAAPKSSKLLSELAEANGLDASNAADRQVMSERLHSVKDSAPNVHISFAVEPKSEFVEKIVTWVRQELHPNGLIKIGLRPSIGAGCIVRTPSHVYNFGIQSYFARQKPLLVKRLKAGQA